MPELTGYSSWGILEALVWIQRFISLPRDESEPSFDLIEPGRRGRSVVDVETGTLSQPEFWPCNKCNKDCEQR